jgi:hypothetical protein
LRHLLAQLRRLRNRLATPSVRHPARFDFSPLESRMMINDPISPSGLIMSLVASGTDPDRGGIYMDLSEAAFSSSAVSGFDFNQTSITDSTTDPFSSSTYDTFHVRYSGVMNLADADAGTYYFRLPAADGAIITIDDHRVIFLPSLIGDTTLNGTVDQHDIDLIIGMGNFGSGTAPHGWMDGDFDNNGQVDGDDIDDMIGVGHYADGTIAYARTIDNTTNADGASAPYDGNYFTGIGVQLASGTHNFRYDYLLYSGGAGNANANAGLQITKGDPNNNNAPGTFAPIDPAMFTQAVLPTAPNAVSTAASPSGGINVSWEAPAGWTGEQGRN